MSNGGDDWTTTLKAHAKQTGKKHGATGGVGVLAVAAMLLQTPAGGKVIEKVFGPGDTNLARVEAATTADELWRLKDELKHMHSHIDKLLYEMERDSLLSVRQVEHIRNGD